MLRLLRILIVPVLCAGLAACGGSSDGDDPSPATAQPGAGRQEGTAPRADTRRADAGSLSVIRGWAAAQGKGDTTKAASFFALPTIVANGSDPLRLTKPSQIRGFNKALPCGADITRAYDAGRYTVVTFRLTRRPGADCGEGTGGSASTAFQIRAGKIAQWLRVPDALADQGSAPRAPSPQTPPDEDPGEERPVV